ncbi:MAG TPA: BTAD domain-containing putative transcriptional regulator [Gaiellaceae bacterium]|nr:BTAD domain-containing putative transcriptional regulator [Gaiellaceae bacterium]
MTLRVYLAGHVAVERGDVLVTEKRLPGRQGRLTLAVLGWERDRAVSTDELAEIVWDGAPPASWQTALRALVSKLRGALEGVAPDAGIEHAFGCYQLRLPSDAWVDVEAADAAVHEAEAALRAGDLQGATGAALVATAIGRRPFLAGDEGAWVEARREHLRQVRVRALEARGRAALSNGDPVAAVVDGDLVVELEPYRETGHVLLMQAHVAAGNTAQALAVYERLRTRLADELGAEPSPETESVFLEILRRSDR